ncbi:MAG: transposase, partial [Deltaproteobacteria bacterium]|nr:transposase [Deltaproteobacteria bacterium]
CDIKFKKADGYSTSEIITFLVLIPLMLLKTVNSLYKSQYKTITSMKKDVFYRLQNNERMPWRRLLYGVGKQFCKLVNPAKEVADNSAFIIDDTIDARVGAQIENISYVHDHVAGRKGSKLGFKELFLGFFDGKSFIPIDFSIHTERTLKSKQKKKQFMKNCTKNSNGYKRRKECKIKKNTNALAMIKRAVKNGFMAKYVLTDSWFSSKEFIQEL